MIDRRTFVQAIAAGPVTATLAAAPCRPQVFLSSYDRIAPHVRTGDTIVWSSTGKKLIHRMYVKGIKRRTGPVTHISTAVWITVGGHHWLHLAETMENGLVLDSFQRRLSEGTKEGWTHCWWFPLSKERRAKFDEDRFVRYLFDRVDRGTRYDVRQAIRSSTDRKDNQPDDDKLFCSEWHMAALQRAGSVRNCNYSEATPMDVVRFRLHAPKVYAFWKQQDWPWIALGRYINTVEPDGWRGY